MTEYTIYKISCNDDSITDFYIGSTNDFNRRKKEHKTRCNSSDKKYCALKIYQFIRDNNGWDNFTMSIIETFNCEDKINALKKEQEYINNLKPTLNTHYAHRFDEKEWYEQYYEQNKSDILEKNRQYYEQNKLKILEQKKQYAEQNKEKKKEYMKQYAEQNKEKKKEYMRQYQLKKKLEKQLKEKLTNNTSELTNESN